MVAGVEGAGKTRADIDPATCSSPRVSHPFADHRCGGREQIRCRVAASYGVSRSWLYELLARYRREGEAAFEARSRRPRSAPTALAAEAVELIAELRAKLTATGVDAGPDTIRWHLAGHWFCQVGERACGFLLPMTELLVSVAGVRVGVRALGAHADLCDLTVGVGQLASFGLPVMAKDPGAKLEAA